MPGKIALRPGLDAWRTEQDAFLLASAAGRKDVAEIQSLLGLRMDIDSRTADGRSALHHAAATGSVDAVQALIKGGAEMDASDLNGVTPLMVAILNKDAEMVFTLLRGGCRLLHRDKAGRSALDLLLAGDPAIIKALCAAGADDSLRDPAGNTPLHSAILAKDLDATRKLLRFCRDLELTNAKGRTPFLVAVQQGEVEIAAMLRLSGCNLAATDGFARGAFALAALKGHVPMLEALHGWGVRIVHDIRASFKIPAGEERFRTATIDYAFRGGSVAVVKKLLELGEKPVERNSMLPMAVRNNKAEMLRQLIEWGDDPNLIYHGKSALQNAVSHGSRDAARILIENGALLEQDSDRTPLLNLAIANDDAAMVTLLLEAGADPNSSRGRIPALLLAAGRGNLAIVTKLIAAGADVHAKGIGGSTAVELAMQDGHAAVVAALINAGAVYTPNAEHERTVLARAIDTRQADKVETYLQLGFRVSDETREFARARKIKSPQVLDQLIRAARAIVPLALTPADWPGHTGAWVDLLDAMLVHVSDLSPGDARTAQLERWLMKQGLYSIHWRELEKALVTLDEWASFITMNNEKPTARQRLITLAFLLLKSEEPDYDAVYRETLPYEKGGLVRVESTPPGKTVQDDLIQTARTQFSLLQAAAHMIVNDYCIAIIEKLEITCLANTNWLLEPSTTIARELNLHAGLLPPIANRVEQCANRALAELANEPELDVSLQDLPAFLRSILPARLARASSSLDRVEGFYDRAETSSPLYHAMLSMQIDLVAQYYALAAEAPAASMEEAVDAV